MVLYCDLLMVYWFVLYFCDGKKFYLVVEDNLGLNLIIVVKYIFVMINCYWILCIFFVCEYKLIVWSICIKLYLIGIGKIFWFSFENIV